MSEVKLPYAQGVEGELVFSCWYCGTKFAYQKEWKRKETVVVDNCGYATMVRMDKHKNLRTHRFMMNPHDKNIRRRIAKNV